MGTGKTSVGKLISDTIGYNYIDIDEEIKSRCQMNIGDIFENYGEQYFRNKEEEIAKELSTVNNYVIATGGGIVINHRNITYLKENGIIIWLNASVNKIINNLRSEYSQLEDRPLLKVDNIKERIIQLLYEREKLYINSCDYNLCINDLLIRDVVTDCIDSYYSFQNNEYSYASESSIAE
jgi:shikimate kinase